MTDDPPPPPLPPHPNDPPPCPISRLSRAELGRFEQMAPGLFYQRQQMQWQHLGSPNFRPFFSGFTSICLRLCVFGFISVCLSCSCCLFPPLASICLRICFRLDFHLFNNIISPLFRLSFHFLKFFCFVSRLYFHLLKNIDIIISFFFHFPALLPFA